MQKKKKEKRKIGLFAKPIICDDNNAKRERERERERESLLKETSLRKPIEEFCRFAPFHIQVISNPISPGIQT